MTLHCYTCCKQFEDLRDTEGPPEKQSRLRCVLAWLRSLLRLLWLLLIFTPAAVTAPFAFNYGIHRKRWLVMFRCERSTLGVKSLAH